MNNHITFYGTDYLQVKVLLLVQLKQLKHIMYGYLDIMYGYLHSTKGAALIIIHELDRIRV